MKIDVYLKKNTLTISLNAEEIRIRLANDFFNTIPGKNAYQMFFNKKVNTQIRDFVFRHRNKLSFWEKMNYLINRNTVIAVVDHDVQRIIKEDVLLAYLTLAFDAKKVVIQ